MKIPTFQDLQPGDTLYFLEPSDLSIKEIAVIKSFWLPKYPHHVMVQTLKPFQKDIPLQVVMDAHETFNTKIHIKWVLEKKANFQLVMTSPPTVISTSKEQIKKWLSKK